jgi:2'-5' RNA ligase
MQITLPGKSLAVQFDAVWQRFSRLSYTTDTLSTWSIRWRRWLTPVNVSFIVPLTDPAISGYLIDAQQPLAPYMTYTPQPAEKLHITIRLVGYLRAGLPLPDTWTRAELYTLSNRARTLFAKFPPFEVRVGPINAFPNVAIAEVHDDGQLRLLETAIGDLIPKARRTPRPYPLIPHITLGYFGRRPAEPIIEALRPLRGLQALPLTVNTVALTLYYRSSGSYSSKYLLRHSVEDVIATLPLSGNYEAKSR